MEVAIPFNYVLIKPDKEFSSYQIDGVETGIKTGLEIDSAGQRLSVCGTVVSVPQTLIFNREKLDKLKLNFTNDKFAISQLTHLKSSSMLFDVPIELNVGDRVYFSYLEHYSTYESNRYIEQHDGQDLLFVSYDSLYVRVRDGEVYPLNGYVLFEKEQEPIDDSGLIVLENKKQDKDLAVGVAISTGCLCNRYLDYPEDLEDKDEIKTKDKFLYKTYRANLLEWNLHRTLFLNKYVYLLHRKDILTKCNKNLT